MAGPLNVVARVAAPAVWLLGKTTSLVLRAFGPAPESSRAVSEEELKAILVEGAETGVLETEERDIIERVLRLADKPVRAIMTPRTEIVWLDRTAPKEDIISRLRTAPYSRFVVCDGAIDNVAGVVQAKDILDRVLAGKELSIAAAVRHPIAIPDSVTALEALDRLKGEALGIALVLDEYGSFEGMVTAADVLEAIVGDADDAGPSAHAPQQASDSVYELDGLTPVDETKARLHLPALPNEGSYHTLGGLILARCCAVPAQATPSCSAAGSSRCWPWTDGASSACGWLRRGGINPSLKARNSCRHQEWVGDGLAPIKRRSLTNGFSTHLQDNNEKHKHMGKEIATFCAQPPRTPNAAATACEEYSYRDSC